MKGLEKSCQAVKCLCQWDLGGTEAIGLSHEGHEHRAVAALQLDQGQGCQNISLVHTNFISWNRRAFCVPVSHQSLVLIQLEILGMKPGFSLGSAYGCILLKWLCSPCHPQPLGLYGSLWDGVYNSLQACMTACGPLWQPIWWLVWQSV